LRFLLDAYLPVSPPPKYMRPWRSQRVKNDLIGAAGVHYVAYGLSLRGLIALPTIRNTAGIDLLVSDPTTGSQAALQVKTSLQRVTFWPTSRYDRSLRGGRGLLRIRAKTKA
jgi:hypothetical protein